MSTESFIDLNCDLGESYGTYAANRDEEIMPYISSCNIACGFHSGDPSTILKTIELALEHNVAIGAHPSYPDLQGFGRRVMQMSADELKACMLYQLSALKGLTELCGAKLHHVKPHGALYNHACRFEETAVPVVEAVVAVSDDLLLYAPGDSVLSRVAEDAGLRVVSEVFADRSYDNNLDLRSRKLEGAVLEDEDQILKQLEAMVCNGKVITYEGLELPIQAHTVCLHSDTPGATRLAGRIHEFLKDKGVEIRAI